MSNGSNDTFPGALQVLQTQLSRMLAIPDADIDWVKGAMDMVMQKQRQPELQLANAGVLPQSAANPQGLGALGLPGGGGGLPGLGGGLPPTMGASGMAGDVGRLPPGPPPGALQALGG